MTLDIDFELELACGYEQAQQAQAEQERARPPYTVKCLLNRGGKLGRYKVEKIVPGEKTKVYYVTFGSELMTCTCPDSKYPRTTPAGPATSTI